MKKYILIVFIGMGFSGFNILKAQLFPLLYNTRDNAFIINPAMTGVPLLLERNTQPKNRIKTIAGISSRLQWTQFGDDSPVTHFARIQHQLDSRSRSSNKTTWLGGFFMTDQTGPVRLNVFGVNGSYHIYLGNQNYIQFGISVRMAQQNLDQDKIVVNGDISQDLLLLNNLDNEWFFSSGFGFFYSGKNFYAGVSIPQTTFSSSEDNDVLRLSNHYFANGGVYIPLEAVNRQTFLEPAIWIRTAEDISAIFDFSVKYRSVMEQKIGDIPYWVALGYDTNDSMRAEFGGILGKLKVNLIYSYYFGTLSDFGSGLEGGISFLFSKK